MYKIIFPKNDINSENERKILLYFPYTFQYLKDAFLLEMDLNLTFKSILFSNISIFTKCKMFIILFLLFLG